MSKGIIKLIAICVGSILIVLFLAIFRRFSLQISGISALFFCYIYTYTLLTYTKINPTHTIIAIVLGLTAIQAPLRILYWTDTILTFPDALMYFIGVLLGYLFYRFRIIGKTIVAILSVSICICYFIGFQYFLNKLNSGNWSGQIEEISFEKPIIFRNSNGEQVFLSDFKGHYVVLDFWTSSCGVCFKKFPDFQNFYYKYSRFENIVISSVHCTSSHESYFLGELLLKEKGYTFPALSIDLKDPILKELRVESFPKLLIFDPEGCLIFRGSLELAEDFLFRRITANLNPALPE